PPPPTIMVNRPSNSVSASADRPSRDRTLLLIFGKNLPPIIWTPLTPAPMKAPPANAIARSL
ncbi:hypothetical protein F8279_28585, partial [Micromonospora sp. AMSO1212t]